MANVSVFSEIDCLREAILHRPGRELVRMTPATREQFLFDDLLYTRYAQAEHDWFSALLHDHLGIQVHYLHNLLTEALEQARPADLDALLARTALLESPPQPLERRLGRLEDQVAALSAVVARLTADHAGLPGAADAASRTNPRPQDAEVAPNDPPASRHRGYLEEHLQHLANDGAFTALALTLIEGIETNNPGLAGGFVTPALQKLDMLEDEERLARFVEGRLFHLLPLPNLMFMRDNAAVLGDRVVLSRMGAAARRRETLLLDFLVRSHPRFAGVERWPGGPRVPGAEELPYWEEPPLQHVPATRRGLYPSHAAYLEGGNVMQLRANVLAVGVSPRTTMAAVQRLAVAWEAAAEVAERHIILYVLRLPAGHNHLDSVFSLLSADECVLYRPVFMPYGPASVDVIRVELGRGGAPPERRSSFIGSLADDGLVLQEIYCGGDDAIDQEREEWFSAANVLAVAPGKLITYRSTDRTVAALARAGYEVIDSNDVLYAGRTIRLSGSDKWVLRVRGSELSRGHGGPHSLILPLIREA